MRSWPRSRQEAVYRPAVGDELSDGEMAPWLCVMYANTETQTVAHAHLVCNYFPLSIDYLIEHLFNRVDYRMFDVLTT